MDGDDASRTARSLEVNGVGLRADKELVQETKLRCDLSRGGIVRVRKSPFSEEERRERALGFLAEHPCMCLQDYMFITGLKRTTASLELRRLGADPESGITISGRGNHRVYILRKAGER